MLKIMRGLKEKLAKTRSGFIGKLAEAVQLRGKVDEDLLDEIEEILLKCDTGVEMSQLIRDLLTQRIRLERITQTQQVGEVLQEIMRDILLSDYSADMDFLAGSAQRPWIVLFVGVNGVGKTTSVGKLAWTLVRQGKKVLIIAADTFRAAAIEQLSIWAERAGAAIVKSQQDADPAAIVYDGVNSALSRGYDVVLIDTAGRQHTRENLMKELGKIERTIKKLLPEAPHETLLVLDATTGQNAISQAEKFGQALPLSGLVLAKYDGTAKGGIILNLKHSLGLPVKLIGVGESREDLQPFDAHEFVRAFFPTSINTEEIENED